MEDKFHAETTNCIMSNSSLKRFAFALALIGVAGTVSVLAAPKVGSKGNTPTASKPASQKSSTPGPRSPKGAKSFVPKTPRATTKVGATTKAAGKVTATADAEGFTPSRYPGVVVRNVPQSHPATETAQVGTRPVDTSKGPVVLSERKLPDGSSEVVVQFPPEVATIEPPAPATKTSVVITPPKQVTVSPQIAPKTTPNK